MFAVPAVSLHDKRQNMPELLLVYPDLKEIDNSSNSSDDENNGSEKDIPIRQSNEGILIL
eukprot:13697460-Ditylum_brightwellii.AAC.1